MHVLYVKLVFNKAITKIIMDIALREHQMTVDFFISQLGLEEAEGGGGGRAREQDIMIMTLFINHVLTKETMLEQCIIICL